METLPVDMSLAATTLIQASNSVANLDKNLAGSAKSPSPSLATTWCLGETWRAPFYAQNSQDLEGCEADLSEKSGGLGVDGDGRDGSVNGEDLSINDADVVSVGEKDADDQDKTVDAADMTKSSGDFLESTSKNELDDEGNYAATLLAGQGDRCEGNQETQGPGGSDGVTSLLDVKAGRGKGDQSKSEQCSRNLP